MARNICKMSRKPFSPFDSGHSPPLEISLYVLWSLRPTRAREIGQRQSKVLASLVGTDVCRGQSVTSEMLLTPLALLSPNLVN